MICPLRHLSRFCLALLACSVLGLAFYPPAASAQRPSSSPKRLRARALAALKKLEPRLDHADDAVVHGAIDKVAAIRHPEAVERLAAFIRRGQPDDVLNHVLKALGGMTLPAAIDVLQEFSRHRRASVRKEAYLALAKIPEPGVPLIVALGLRDGDGAVRAAAASALGEMGARHTLDLLFQAFERGVPEAAAAIGRLGDDASVERFSSHLGRRPLQVMLSGYEWFLNRDDIAEKTKLAIVAALGEVSGQEVRQFLQSVLSTGAAKGGEALRRSIEATIRRIAGKTSDR